MRAAWCRCKRRTALQAIADNGGLTLINHDEGVCRLRNLPVGTLVPTVEFGCYSACWPLYLTLGMSSLAACTTGLRDA
jgi:hypothetical protein